MTEMSDGNASVVNSVATRLIGPDLPTRIASAVVLVALAIWTTWLGGPIFATVWFILGVIMFSEWTKIVGGRPVRTLAVAFAAAYMFPAYLLSGLSWDVRDIFVLGAFGSTVLGLGALFLLLRRLPSDTRLWLLAGTLYAGVIVLVPPLIREKSAFGLTGIAWLFAVVWCTDIAAYFCGRLIGGPKLWPAVSPKKTWSGFIGGLVFGVLGGMAALVMAQFYDVPVFASWGNVIFLTACTSIASQLGDLAESALKRRFGVKDSGSIIPGHGGVMDRLDGFWAATLFSLVILVAHRLTAGA